MNGQLIDDRPVRESIQAGLKRVEELEAGDGYLELTGGLRGVGDDFMAYARGEGGYKFTRDLSVFGYAELAKQMDSPVTYEAGAGLRYRF